MNPLKPRLKARAAIPYGGTYQLNVPELGLVGKGTDIDRLLDSIRAYRKANAIPIGLGFEEEVEREVCLRYPIECKESDPRVPPSSILLNYEDVLAGTAHLTGFVAAGRPHVSDEEALRRAMICSTCPFLRPFTKPCGWVCGKLQTLIQEIVGAKRMQLDGRLEAQACGCCKCSIRAIIWVPNDFQTRHLTEFQKSQYRLAVELANCWKGAGL